MCCLLDNVQSDSTAEEIPEKNYDSNDTETDDKGDKTVVPLAESTTISEIPVTATASTIKLTVGLAFGLTVLIIIGLMISFYIKGNILLITSILIPLIR